MKNKKKYDIKLNEIIIGKTHFEYADVPMGIVYGEIDFKIIGTPYELFKNHCKIHNVKIINDEPKLKMIDTAIIPELKIFLENGSKLKGYGGAINGMDSDKYEVQFSGIDYSIMRSEFAHHYYKYYEQECDLIKIKIDEQFKKICKRIITRNFNINQWAEIESSDEFQTKNYCGGFDATEMEFCFSYYENKQEYWFQLSLNDIKRIINNRIEFIYPREID